MLAITILSSINKEKESVSLLKVEAVNLNSEKENTLERDMGKKIWVKPELIEYGNLEKITQDIPPKVFGGSDGASWNSMDVGWGS